MATHFDATHRSAGVLKWAARSAVFVAAASVSFLSQAAMAFVEGEAIYLERVMPPPDAILVVTLENAARADAPAVEHASTSIRLGSGPPYAWRMAYDTQLGDPQQLSVRARISTPAGLWMTTDTRVMAGNGAAPLRLRLVAVGAAKDASSVSANTAPARPEGTSANSADPCASASASASTSASPTSSTTTQADMNRCAYEDFEAAGAGYGQAYSELSKPLPSAQRDRLRRMQTAWIKFRTEACRYESGPVSGGSVYDFIYWRCAARMTRDRTTALQALANCREGDVTCTRRAP